MNKTLGFFVALFLVAFLGACAGHDTVETVPSPETLAYQRELVDLVAQVQTACRRFDSTGERVNKIALRLSGKQSPVAAKKDLNLLLAEFRNFPAYPAKVAELNEALLERQARRVDPIWLVNNITLKDSCRFLEFNLTLPIFVALQNQKLSPTEAKAFFATLSRRVNSNPELDSLIRLLMLSNWMSNLATIPNSPLSAAQKKEAFRIREEAFLLSDKYKNEQKLPAKITAEQEREIANRLAERAPKLLKEARPLFKELKKLSAQIKS